MSAHDDFEPDEPLPGLPEILPDDERLCWQGSPDWWSLAVHGFHIRKVVIYFSLLILWVIVAGLDEGRSLADLYFPLSMLGGLGLSATMLLALLAWGSARCAIFTITDKRLVVRFGVALRMNLNIPMQSISAAGVRAYSDGTGDLPIALCEENKISWLILWPFVRPWRLRAPEVMLRSLRDIDQVSDLLIDLLKSSGSEPVVRFRSKNISRGSDEAADARWDLQAETS